MMKKILIGLWLACAAFVMFYQPQYKAVNVDVRVAKGDTVWSIVDEAMRQVGDDRYILEVISDTKRANNLTSDKIGNLPIGTVIVVPCKVKI